MAARINTLCHGALGQLLNHFLPTHLLKEKRRQGTLHQETWVKAVAALAGRTGGGKKFASVERSHCFGFAVDATSTSATR